MPNDTIRPPRPLPRLDALVRCQTHALGGVEIRIAELHLAMTSDSRGTFAFDHIPSGRWHVAPRRIGYASIDTAVDVANAPPPTLAFTLRALPQELDTVNVSARLHSSAEIPEFEARRAHATGRFLTRDDLRANDDRGFVDVLRSRVPGLAFQITAYGVRAYSPTQQAPGALNSRNRDAGKPCYTQIVVDGIVVYQVAMTGGDPPPDLSEFLTRSLDGVEYYSSPSRTPQEPRTTGAACGRLVLWTRRR